MMEMNTTFNVSYIMQVAVTPVFLLAGIGALLNVITARLGRIKDRIRIIQKAFFNTHEENDRRILNNARLKLILRSRFCYASICFSAASGLFVCFVIMTLFLEGLYQKDGSILVVALFVSCMIFLIISLLFLVIEVFIATRSIHKKIEDTERVMSTLDR